jgi:general secretion pathway protein D
MSLSMSRLLTGSVSVLGLSLMTLSGSLLMGCASNQDENTEITAESSADEPSSTASSMSENSANAESASMAETSQDDEAMSSGAASSNEGAQESLAKQRNEFLVQRHLGLAERLIQQLRFEEAKAELLQATKIDPANQKVRTMLGRVREQLGERAGPIESYADYMAKLLEIRIQKDIADANRLLASAEEKMNEGQYGEAEKELRRVEVKLQVGTGIDWGQIPARLATLQQRSNTEREAAEAAMEEEARRESQARLVREAERRRALRERQVNFHLAKAAASFEKRSFEETRTQAQAALDVDPLNEEAREFLEIAEKAIRNRTNEEYIASKARRFKEYQLANAERRIPYTDTFIAPDAAYWRKITEARKDLVAIDAGNESEDTRALREKLETTRLSAGLEYNEDNGDYMAVFENLTTLTGVSILVAPEAREVVEGSGFVLNLRLESPLSLKYFLNIMVDRAERQIAYTIEDGAVVITTPAKALGKPIVKVYPIGDLTFMFKNFAGPIIRDLPIGGGVESEEAPRSGGEVGDPRPFMEAETLQVMIQNSVGRGTWDAEGVAIDLSSRNLIVTHTPKVQAQIAQFLTDLRKFTTSLVTVESKFLRVQQNWLQEFGVDFRGLGGTNSKGTVAQLDDLTNGAPSNSSQGLDNSGTGDPNGKPNAGFFYDDGLDGDFRGRTENYFSDPLGNLLSTNGGASLGLTILDDLQLNVLIRAVEKSQNIEVVDSQTLTVINGNRANVSVINQTAYVQDFNVEVAQNAFIADPDVNVIQDGVVLDVRPTISYDRRYITLDLQPTVAELLRPIPTFTTSLSGLTQPVVIMFPQMTVRSAATTVKVPDGGSVLIGGLNRVFKRDRRAEVPWLADIPLLSFFFKQEGSVEETSALMVLVKAYILDVEARMRELERTGR